MRGGEQGEYLALVDGHAERIGGLERERPPAGMAQRLPEGAERDEDFARIVAAGIDELPRHHRTVHPTADDATPRPDEEMLAVAEPSCIRRGRRRC